MDPRKRRGQLFIASVLAAATISFAGSGFFKGRTDREDSGDKRRGVLLYGWHVQRI
jgi:hypothetical protein